MVLRTVPHDQGKPSGEGGWSTANGTSLASTRRRHVGPLFPSDVGNLSAVVGLVLWRRLVICGVEHHIQILSEDSLLGQTLDHPVHHRCQLLRPYLHDGVRNRLERERTSNLNRSGPSAQPSLGAPFLNLHGVEPQKPHQRFVRQKNLVRGQHALHGHQRSA